MRLACRLNVACGLTVGEQEVANGREYSVAREDDRLVP